MCHSSAILFAAFDTSSTALSRILYLLALDPQRQVRLRQEIAEARNGGDIPFDVLTTLPLLDGVVKETLRVYVPRLPMKGTPFFIALMF